MTKEADFITKIDAYAFKAYGIDANEYPVMAELLSIFESLPTEKKDYVHLADELLEADFTKIMPKCVVGLVRAIYKYAIKQGDSKAANNLGCMYYRGRVSGEPDYAEAAKYYEMADKMGNILATENLAYIYYYGLGCEVDYEKAYLYFSKAALGGRYEATYMLGDMFRTGKYCPKDDFMTFHCYTKAERLLSESKQSDAWGCIYHRIGDLFYYGIGTDKDLMAALHFYQLAETGYYDQMACGDRYHDKQLKKVLELQKKIRATIKDNLPKYNY